MIGKAWMGNNNIKLSSSRLVALSMALLLFSTLCASALNDDFQNWGVQRLGNAWIYSAPGLERGKAFTITLFPAVDIGDSSRQAWFRRFVAKDIARLGKVTKRGKLRQDKNRILGVTGHSKALLTHRCQIGYERAIGKLFFPDSRCQIKDMTVWVQTDALQNIHQVGIGVDSL